MSELAASDGLTEAIEPGISELAPVATGRTDAVRACLEKAFRLAEELVDGAESVKDEFIKSTPQLAPAIELARIKHAFRGAALTLIAYKCCFPEQDIRAHKAEYTGGFPARTIDTVATVPFLIEMTLPRSVESHWMTQTLSFALQLERGTVLKTQPRKAGPLLVEVVNLAEDDQGGEFAQKMLVAMLIQMVEIRNKGRVVLTRPKALPIQDVKGLITRHFAKRYATGAPRLPQIAIQAIYACLIKHVARYDGQRLEPLARLKSADRKAGTVGDVVVTMNSKPVEAVEIKYGLPISLIHVLEAIDKVRSESVSRYYMLSTHGVIASELSDIREEIEQFRIRNGCEIIVNGVIETIAYYLRLLPDTTEFIKNYADILENDDDVGYEHRICWNECCKTI